MPINSIRSNYFVVKIIYQLIKGCKSEMCMLVSCSPKWKRRGKAEVHSECRSVFGRLCTLHTHFCQQVAGGTGQTSTWLWEDRSVTAGAQVSRSPATGMSERTHACLLPGKAVSLGPSPGRQGGKLFIAPKLPASSPPHFYWEIIDIHHYIHLRHTAGWFDLLYCKRIITIGSVNIRFLLQIQWKEKKE